MSSRNAQEETVNKINEATALIEAYEAAFDSFLELHNIDAHRIDLYKTKLRYAIKVIEYLKEARPSTRRATCDEALKILNSEVTNAHISGTGSGILGVPADSSNAKRKT